MTQPVSADSMLEIILDDGPVLAVNKPSGLLTVGAKPDVPTLERQIKAYLKDRFQKPGNVYLGIPHRLDRPVSGVILFARNSKAADRLAEQFRERTISKTYWAVVQSGPTEAEGLLVDWMAKVPDQAAAEVVDPTHPLAREARLKYRVRGLTPAGPLLEIQLETGRMHQIRVQLATRGWPVLGDVQYGAAAPLAGFVAEDPTHGPIMLHARNLTFLHPVRYDSVTVVAPLPAHWLALGVTEQS